MEEEVAELVAGDNGYISDESSFCGSPNTKSRLEKRIARSTPPAESAFWTAQPGITSVIAYKNRKPPAPAQPSYTATAKIASKSSHTEASPADPKGKGKSRTYISNDGQIAWRQSHESASDYVARLPPSTTTRETAKSPWIWVDNPHIDPSTRERFDKDDLVEKGDALLAEFRDFEAKTREEMKGKTEGVIGRKLGPARRKLETDLKACAVEVGCLSGKWMLFPAVEEVDEVWSKVVDGIISNKLGPVAKVATSGSERDAGVRIICVYTKDFGDVKDVERVLRALVEMELVGDEEDYGGGIYYKCDAWTYWGIESKNEYKLKASFYGSRDMLRDGVVGVGVERKVEVASGEKKRKVGDAGDGTNRRKK